MPTPNLEIVTNADKTLAVLDGDGTVLWTALFGQYVWCRRCWPT